VSKSNAKRQSILDAGFSLFRAKGFDKTSMAEITARVGGSKATVYSYFPSKEDLFTECVMWAVEDYMVDMLKALDTPYADPAVALRNFGAGVLNFICSPEQLEVRRLIIAEAARSGTGRLFFDKISSLRARVSEFLSACMAAGSLRADDPDLAAHQFGALLEAEILEPLLLQVREGAPNHQETAAAAGRAVEAFMRVYAPTGDNREPIKGHRKQSGS
jgi:AcrR family transcriptional regulator